MAMKVTSEGFVNKKNNKFRKDKKLPKFSIPSRLDVKKPLKRGFFTSLAGREAQSPNIFCFNSRRCWASNDKVAVGRANKRPTPIGSPVSSQ